MRLGEMLIAGGLATPAQVDEALEGQVIHGGRIGTNMVEREFVRLDDLAELLAKQHGMPPALKPHFDRADPELQQRLPAELAARWHAVPLMLLGGTQPVVAVTDPLTSVGIEALAGALGSKITLTIAPELRILYHLEKVYGVDRLNRFVRLRSDQDRPNAADQRRYVSTACESVPVEPNALARVAVRKIAVSATERQAQLTTINSLESGLKVMRRSQDRARLEAALVDTIDATLVPPLDGLLVLVRRGPFVTGWTGRVDSESNGVILSVAIKIEYDPILAEALTSQQLTRGEPPRGATHEHLWSALAVPTPNCAVAAPVVMGEDTVAVLYGFDQQPIEPRTEEIMAALAGALGTDFARLLRAAER